MDENTSKKAFSLRFQEACRDKGTTNQGDLARLFGVTQGMISQYWLGSKMPATGKAAEIASELEVTMDWLFCGRGAKAVNHAPLPPSIVELAIEFPDLTKAERVALSAAVHAMRAKPTL